MPDSSTLREVAAARLQDAQVLLANQRFDGAAYVCGYAVELSLKARICDTLSWQSFPDTKKEWEGLASFKTHKLDLLLHLSGRELDIKTNYLTDWSLVADWDPEMRYKPVGTISTNDARTFLQATATLLNVL